MLEKEIIYEILRLRYVECKKLKEIMEALNTNKPTIKRYCDKISKEEFLLQIEECESTDDFIEKHPEIFSQQREKHILTNEQCELIRELCLEHLNCYITKEDAQILRRDKLDDIFYIKHSAEWLNENKEEYYLEREKLLKKLEKELAKITSGKDLGKNYSEVYELYLEEVKHRNLTPISKESFYLEARTYWTEEE